MQDSPPTSAGSLSRMPLTVRFAEQGQASACARRLVGLAGVPVLVDGDLWEVGIDGEKTQSVVVRVLDAVRQTLDGETTAFALVSLDGREYRLYGE
jgi:hypothetical protein